MITLVRRANRLARNRAQAINLVLPSPSSSQRMVRALLSQRIAMLATDETGRCVAANEAAVSISGYSVDELRGMQLQNSARSAPINIPLLYVCQRCGATLTIPPPPLTLPSRDPHQSE